MEITSINTSPPPILTLFNIFMFAIAIRAVCEIPTLLPISIEEFGYTTNVHF